jgi:hypothetical protein
MSSADGFTMFCERIAFAIPVGSDTLPGTTT